MALNYPPLIVTPPPVEPAVGGLYTVVNQPELPAGADQNRWELGGVEYQATTCGQPVGFSDTCPPTVPDDMEATLTLPDVSGTPFGLELGVTCKLTGHTLQEFRDIVVRAFRLNEQRVVEEVFWTGSLDNRPSLAGTVADPSDCVVLDGATTAAPLSVTEGVAALEEYLGANYAGVGVIHAPRRVAPYAADVQLLVDPAGPRVRTPLGTRWAFGGGYAVNTGPTGVAAPAGVAWMYATGQVSLWRSDVWVNPDDLDYAFNTRTNDVEVFAQGKFALTYECVCAAVPVALP